MVVGAVDNAGDLWAYSKVSPDPKHELKIHAPGARIDVADAVGGKKLRSGTSFCM